MWHSTHESSHHGGNDCSEPPRQHSGGWGHDQGHGQHHGGGWGGHGGGWGGNGGFHGAGWSSAGDCNDDPGWIRADDCNDDRGLSGAGDCHDGGRGLITFDHNSFLVCH